MKKIMMIAIIFIATLNLQAAKVAGPDENGRLYNTAYLDIKSDTQAPVYDIIGYSKRAGTFNWEKIYNSLGAFNADRIEYIVKTRIEIPKDILTNDVYITVGKNFYMRTKTNNGCCSDLSKSTKLYPTTEIKSGSSESFISLTTKINKQAIQSSTAILTKTKKDTFGNRYVDLEIIFLVDIADKKYVASSKERIGMVVKNNLYSKLDTIKIKVAPKSRTFQSKWVEPKIYVMDE